MTTIPVPALKELLEEFPLCEFKPLAYYDESLDCIRVEVRDCSVTEWRLSELITVLEDNYPEQDQSRFVGFTLKGVKHLFVSVELPTSGVLRITDLLDKIVKKYPNEVMKLFEDQYRPLLALLRDIELKVNLAELPKAA